MEGRAGLPRPRRSRSMAGLATSLNAQGVWDRLAPHVDQNDFVLVIGVTREYHGWLPQEAWDWIDSRPAKVAA